MTQGTPGAPPLPRHVDDGEELGRAVFSNRQRQAAERGRAPYSAFFERAGVRTISVTRMSYAPAAEAAAIGDAVGARREPPATLHGWLIVAAFRVRAIGCDAAASPLGENPYHADVVLPAIAAEDRDAQRAFAQRLAQASLWRGRL